MKIISDLLVIKLIKNGKCSVQSAPHAACLSSRFWGFLLGAAVILLMLSVQGIALADSATWNLNPANGDWNTANNWAPATIPNGPSDTATFDSSNTTNVSLSAQTDVNGIAFNSGASAFTITASPMFRLDISGTGITNNSGLTQNFIAAVDVRGSVGVIRFSNSATAGSQTAFTNNGSLMGGGFGGITRFLDSSTAGNGTFTTYGGAVSTANGGFTQFFGNSTAGNAVFTTNGGAVGGGSGFTQFFGGSTAANGIFITNGGAVGAGSGGTQFFGNSTAAYGNFTTNGGLVSGLVGGVTAFADSSTAGNGTFTTNGGAVSGAVGGTTEFLGESAAGNATLISNSELGGGTGGRIFFFDDSRGDTARVEVFGNGNLDISGHNPPGVTVGSIEGDGLVFLGANNLTVGSNNLSTHFSGVIQDGGIGGDAGGSLSKVGTGELVLTHGSTYTGGTTINGGKLLVNNKGGSGTGSGVVQVNAGRLGGKGRIAGAVTLGTGSGSGAILSPGISGAGTLTIQSTLTLNPDATYNFELNSRTARADKVVANGVTISGAQFSFAGLGKALTPGTVFTVIDNTAATPITGTFSNLADGSIFTVNGHTFQASYEGGDGNDLTLTVLP